MINRGKGKRGSSVWLRAYIIVVSAVFWLKLRSLLKGFSWLSVCVIVFRVFFRFLYIVGFFSAENMFVFCFENY